MSICLLIKKKTETHGRLKSSTKTGVAKSSGSPKEVLQPNGNYNAIFQYFDVRKTLGTKQGVCFDFSHLFAALCRSQNIPCYVVDGTPYDRATEDHTWNRVYYDGCWWDLDVTNDISCTASGKNLYGFRKLVGASAPDKDYFITKIY